MTKTTTEILQETINYYGEDLNRRATIHNRCEYLTSDGRMCAVGRCIQKDQLPSFQRDFEGESVPKSDYLEPVLREEYRGMPHDFWEQLQTLHDDKSCWGHAGLSQVGIAWVENRLHEYVDLSQINFRPFAK